MASPPKYENLRQDPDIKLWVANHKKEITANEQLRRLGRFCAMFQVTPQDIVNLGKPPKGSPQQAKKWLIEKKSILESKGMQGNYIANFVKSLTSWLEFNDVLLPDRPPINIRGRGKNRKYAKEKPPSPQELQLLLNISDLRAKVAISLIAFSGIRPRTLGNYRGTDGLRISDLPEMHVDYEKHTVKFEVYDDRKKEWIPRPPPTRITVREEINKGEDRGYETFLNEQGCEYLKIYLEERMTPKLDRVYDNKGRPLRDKETGEQIEELRAEKLSPDTPIVAHNHPYRLQYWKEGEVKYYGETFVPAQNISYAIITPAIRKLGLRQPNGEPDRPYVLRSYFDTRIMSAEADKKIGVIYSWRQLWMGHSEGIEAVYTTNKTIPDDILEQMRKAYAEASNAYLTVPKTAMVSMEEATNEFKRLYLAGYGKMSEEEISGLGELTNYTIEHLTEIIEKRNPTLPQVNKPKFPLAPAKQIVVPVKEVKKFLSKGYRYRAKLSAQEVILEPLPLT